jgi:hypothetical protein
LGVNELLNKTIDLSPVPGTGWWERRFPAMTTRDTYMKKAQACVAAAEMLHDPAEREAMLKVGVCYVMLADYVSARLDHATAHRGGNRRGVQPDS